MSAIRVFQSSVTPVLGLVGHLYSLLTLHTGQAELVVYLFEGCLGHFSGHHIPFHFSTALCGAHLLPPLARPASFTFFPPLPVPLLLEWDLITLTFVSKWVSQIHDLVNLISHGWILASP